MNKRGQLGIIVLSLTLIFIPSAGCSLLGDLEPEQKKRERLQLEQYVGWTREQIIAKFGEPTYIDYNMKYNVDFDEENKKWIKETADECLMYRYYEGIPLLTGGLYSITFYITHNKVVHAKFL